VGVGERGGGGCGRSEGAVREFSRRQGGGVGEARVDCVVEKGAVFITEEIG